MRVCEAQDRTGAHTACSCLLCAQPGRVTAQPFLLPAHGHTAHICGDTQAHAHLCGPTPAPTPHPSRCARYNMQSCAHRPHAHTTFGQHRHVHTSSFHSFPSHPPSSSSYWHLSTTPSPPLAALCCSDTSFNKFALVVTSRMWPWGGERPAAPDFTCLYVNHGHSLCQTLSTTFLPLLQPWSEVGGPGPPPWP